MQVKPSYGVSSGTNGAAALVAQPAIPGPGVSTSNLDSTRMRIVKRGCVVEFPGGATARVARVRLGQFWPAGLGRMSFTSCNRVRVIA